MPLEGGTTFAGYTVLRLLGSGAMGEVYLAEHPRLARREALRILGRELSANDDYRERFASEADLAAALWHPNIVRVNDRGEFAGQLWISTDFVDGTDAASLLRKRYPLGMPADEVATLVSAVAGALDHAHEHGLLHRNVTPANILLTDPEDGDRRVFLSDLGIARNITTGALPYAAPEQLVDEPVDGRADQYALAATAYHLLAGLRLFPQSNPADVVARDPDAPPPALADTRSDLAALDPALATARARDPGDRFSSCTEFAREFADAAQRLTAAAMPTTEAPAAGEPAASAPPSQPQSAGADTEPRWRPSRRLLLGAALAAVLLAVAGVVGLTSLPKHGTTSSSPSSASPSAPAHVLDGTYRLVYDFTKQTFNGAPVPQPNDDNVSWWAFRSLCTSTGCVATGTGLDKDNPQVPRAPAYTESLRFVDGHWQQTQATPDRRRQERPQCLGADGSVVAGTQTVTTVMSLEPQPDGALRGALTSTTLTNECGDQGAVNVLPFTATRTGDRPSGVTVADPANVAAASTTGGATPAVPGPVLDGAYRLDSDNAHQTLNGAPIAGGRQEIHWWAFRSLCTTTRCVATGASLSDFNPQEPAGAAIVFEFANGQWQNAPALQAVKPCDAEYSGGRTLPGNIGDTNTNLWTLVPQLDGTLRGTATTTVLSNECGFKGSVFQTPILATRMGDAPSSVVLADPALF